MHLENAELLLRVGITASEEMSWHDGRKDGPSNAEASFPALTVHVNMPSNSEPN